MTYRLCEAENYDLFYYCELQTARIQFKWNNIVEQTL